MVLSRMNHEEDGFLGEVDQHNYTMCYYCIIQNQSEWRNDMGHKGGSDRVTRYHHIYLLFVLKL